jgi:hypothetical protein
MQLKTLNNEYCQNLYEKYVVKDAAYFQRFEDLYTALIEVRSCVSGSDLGSC